MKKISVLSLLFFSINLLAQIDPIAPASHFESPDRIYYQTANPVEGSKYLFNTWENENLIYYKGKSYKNNNININLESDNFEFKLSKNSDVILDLNRIDSVFINSRKFMPFNFNGENRIFEVLTYTQNTDLLKGFDIRFVEGRANPLVSAPVNKYVVNSRYFVRKDGVFKFKLKKKKILSLFKDEKENIIQFVKQNNLSYKKENDVAQIFLYYNRLKK